MHANHRSVRALVRPDGYCQSLARREGRRHPAPDPGTRSPAREADRGGEARPCGSCLIARRARPTETAKAMVDQARLAPPAPQLEVLTLNAPQASGLRQSPIRSLVSAT